MSDTGHHEHEVAGHEIDKMPNRRLFNLLFGLSALILLASIGVVQLFNLQVADIEGRRARMGSFQLAEYEAQMDAVAKGRGTVMVREYDGKEAPRTYIPIAEAKQKLLDNPELLKARAPYAAWRNTDTYQAIEQVRQQAAADAPRRPAEPTVEDDGAEALEGAPTEDPAADGGEAEEKPAAPEPTGDGGDEPAQKDPEPEGNAGKPDKPAKDEPSAADSGNDSEGGH